VAFGSGGRLPERRPLPVASGALGSTRTTKAVTVGRFGPIGANSRADRCKTVQANGRLRSLPGRVNDLLSVREIAARLGVSTATVYKLCGHGELPHVRVSNAIRIAPADLAEFIARWRRPSLKH